MTGDNWRCIYDKGIAEMLQKSFKDPRVTIGSFVAEQRFEPDELTRPCSHLWHHNDATTMTSAEFAGLSRVPVPTAVSLRARPGNVTKLDDAIYKARARPCSRRACPDRGPADSWREASIHAIRADPRPTDSELKPTQPYGAFNDQRLQELPGLGFKGARDAPRTSISLAPLR